MNSIQATLSSWLLNSLVQISLFAIMAGAFSRFVARARAKQQHAFYAVVLLFCLAAPIANTFWHSASPVASNTQQQSHAKYGEAANHRFWSWKNEGGQQNPFTIGPLLQCWIGSVWAIFVLLQLTRFIQALYRIHRLRRDAFELLPAQAGIPHEIIESRVSVLQSSSIDDPMTFGLFDPVILLPSKLLPDLNPKEVLAIVAHELGHIRHRDFPLNMMGKLLTLPVAWHPGIAYLMSKVSQTRELASDEFATTFFESHVSYGNTLLRLASLCLHVPRLNTTGVGFFDGDNLEARINMLTRKFVFLSRTGIIGLVLAASATFGGGAVILHAMSFQASTKASNTAAGFLGTWHWMFEGKSFATMVLAQDQDHLTGTVTGSRIALDDDGSLSQAEPSEDQTPKPITKAILDGSMLHVTVKDGEEPFEFVVTLKDASHAEIHPKGAPSKMKPIPAEKTS
jgi:beta-lactamase regulating signal transducer with metallopeptidase domain